MAVRVGRSCGAGRGCCLLGDAQLLDRLVFCFPWSVSFLLFFTSFCVNSRLGNPRPLRRRIAAGRSEEFMILVTGRPSHAPLPHHVFTAVAACAAYGLQAAAPAALRCRQMLPSTALLSKGIDSGPACPSFQSDLSVPSRLLLSRPMTRDHLATKTTI